MYKRVLVVAMLTLLVVLTGCAAETAGVVSSGSTESASTEVALRVEQAAQAPAAAGTTYTIVDTGQTGCYNNRSGISCPVEGDAFFGQDGNYTGVQARYRDNGDGTITDLNTGLTWTQAYYGKMTWEEALSSAESFSLGGDDDWRLPTIKELYSLMDYNGSVRNQVPYLDTDTFEFVYGDTSQGEREIDAQYWSSTKYVAQTMLGNATSGNETAFGVNFADGRIKGYPVAVGNREHLMYVRYVRGNTSYGINSYVDNGNGTITDHATGLTWMQNDSAATLDWEDALLYCESLDYAGSDVWRLPNAKELHSIVDYSRSPTTTNSAAIDPIFNVTEIESWYWSSTTFLDSGIPDNAVYLAFGRAFGLPNGTLTDVHGAGAQRSDPKTGDPADYASGRGSQGQEDQVRIYNYARCVTGNDPDLNTGGSAPATSSGTLQQPPQVDGEQPPQDGQQPPPGGRPQGGPPPRRR